MINDTLALTAGFVPPSTVVTLNGNRDFDSEELIAIEVGVRDRLTDDLLVDLAAFYYDYDDLVATTPGAPIAGPPTIQPFFFVNRGDAEALGIEGAASYWVGDGWELNGTATFIDLRRSVDGTAPDILNAGEEATPDYILSLRSSHDVLQDVDLDLGIYAVGGLERVPSYVRGDVRIAWRADDAWEISIVGQNLFEDEHKEFASDLLSQASEVERGVFAQIVWQP